MKLTHNIGQLSLSDAWPNSAPITKPIKKVWMDELIRVCPWIKDFEKPAKNNVRRTLTCRWPARQGTVLILVALVTQRWCALRFASGGRNRPSMERGERARDSGEPASHRGVQRQAY